MKKFMIRFFPIIILFLIFIPFLHAGEESTSLFTAKDLMNIKTGNEIQISPNGQWIAYTVYVNRSTTDKPGPAYKELYLVSTLTRQVKPFITGAVSISSIHWSPDGSKITFLMKRGDDSNTQVWAIPIDGGEAIQQTFFETDIDKYQWHPTENKIAFTAYAPLSAEEKAKEKKLKDKGYDFIFFEENLKHKNLYIVDIPYNSSTIKQLTKDITVNNFVFSPNGKTIAAAAITKNLTDYDYMFKKLYLVDIQSATFSQLTNNPGKLGNFYFSPDSTKLTYVGALDQKDHEYSQVFVVDTKTKEEKNLTIKDFPGHVAWVAWKDNNTILYLASERGCPTLTLVPAIGGPHTVIFNSKKTGVTFEKEKLSYTNDFKYLAFIGSTPTVPADVYLWKPGQPQPERLVTLNPWLASKKLGDQEVIRYKARDGLEIEGILIYPIEYKKGEKYPLIVDVHGGPESHLTNRWVSRYGSPGQVLAAKGYVVFFPNYRASTGYGYKFALEGYKDPAGKEFDDIADGIDYLVNTGIADKERVGLGGGSYGGFAAAWFATYYTQYVRAVCMFVGISDIISKRGTTDIPYEEQLVHSGDVLENMWDLELKRSPIYYASKSKTAVLIMGGTNDPRVHPSQSLEFYRALKMNNHPAVRLVQYPGEEHGNRKQTSQIDLLNRMIQWYDWYVKDKKPMNSDAMPPLDISNCYGL